MNIKRIIDRNGKLIWYIAIIIVFTLFAIKSLNSYYEQEAENKTEEGSEYAVNDEDVTQYFLSDEYTTESGYIEITMASFIGFCNNREIENAYAMLTEECKNAMFPTIEEFEQIYINNIYNVKRSYEYVRWSTDGDRATYLVTLYGDILATGGTSHNTTQEYYTFIEDESGVYKLNINNYIYGEDRNIETTVNNITIKIGHVDVYEEYEKATITITNNTSKKICLTGNTYRNNIYLQSSQDTTYSSLNSIFDNEEVIMNPNSVRTCIVEFNKVYSSINKPKYLVLGDVILDYEDYLNSEDKENYSNRTSIKVGY